MIKALKIITADPSVKAILIYIYGGIARVDVIAQGLVDAHKEIDINIPLVVKLAGTNATEGKRILAESRINYIKASDFRDAAQKAVTAAKGDTI